MHSPEVLRHARACVFVLLIGLVSSTGTASAYAGQLGLAVASGYSGIASNTVLPAHGLALSVAAAYGIDDTFEVRLRGTWAFHPDSAGALHRFAPGVEFVYLLDILEFVPLFGVGLDVPFSWSPESATAPWWVDAAAHGLLGLDWLPSRGWSVGVEVRPYLHITEWSGDRGVVWVTADLRFQWLVDL